jgi:WD40 repeat protein
VAYVWDPAQIDPTQQALPVLPLRGHERPIVSAEFNGAGQIVTASRDGTARVWDGKTGDVIAVLRGHEQALHTTSFDPGGSRVVTASPDGTARIWQVRPDKKYALPFAGHGKPVLSIDFSPEGRYVVTTAEEDKTARIWDVATGGEYAVLRAEDKQAGCSAQHLGEVRTARFSPDGQTVLVVTHDALVHVDGKDLPFAPLHLWDVKTRKVRARLAGPETNVLSAAFSPDGRWIMALESGEVSTYRILHHNQMSSGIRKEPVVRVWDAGTGRQVLTLKGHEGPLTSASFSPDGRRLLTTIRPEEDRPSVHIWDVPSGEKLTTIPEGMRWGSPIAQFSPDGGKVLTGSLALVRLWDVETGKEVVRLHGSQRDFGFARFSPNGRWILTLADQQGTSLRLWDTATGEAHATLHGHLRAVRSAEFSADGRFVVTASDDETARVWDVETGEERFTLTGHQGAVNFARFSPDSSRVATASADGTGRLWLLDLLPIAKARRPRELTAEERRRFGIAEEN